MVENRPQEYAGHPHSPPHPSEEDVLYWIAIAAIPGIGPGRLLKLMSSFETGERAWKASRADWETAGFPNNAARMRQEPQRIDLSALAKAHRGPWQILTFSHEHYPKLLREIADPPAILYVQGSLAALTKPMIAVVGTRHPSPYGTLVTKKLVLPLVQAGMTIVSGLAFGIDATAHQATLAAGGTTIAVLGSGLRRIHPVFHARLAEEIVKTGGAVISEYAPDTGPQSYQFPMRNRIIAGLCQGVLVTEAPAKSGALITASCALDAGRDVFAVPGDLTRPQSEGTNALIRDGAHLVTAGEDLLAHFSFAPSATAKERENTPTRALTPEEERLVSALRDQSLHIDRIVQITGLAVATVSHLLAQLEMDDVVEDIGGMTFRKK